MGKAEDIARDLGISRPTLISYLLKFGVVSSSKRIDWDSIDMTEIKNFCKLPLQERQRILAKKTFLEKYGVDNPAKSQAVKDKAKNTFRKKYGVDNPFAAEEVKDKIKATWVEKYGVDNPQKNRDIYEKSRYTCLKRYGAEFPVQNNDIKEKTANTCLEKYGAKRYISSESFKEKSTLTKDSTQAKRRETCLKRYGVAHPLNYRYCYEGEYFDSSWELAFWIYHRDAGSTIVHEPVELLYIFNTGVHYYYPDFSVNGELIEIKGDHFFNENGEMICPFDASKNSLFNAKLKCAEKNEVKILTHKDIEDAIAYCEKRYTKDFLYLFKMHTPFPYPNDNLSDKSDAGLIRHFHKSIFKAHRGSSLSPLEAWDDKELVKKSALNRLRFKSRCKPSDVLAGFSVAKIAPKVSVFSPNLAKSLIADYAKEVELIFDPFSGFSGRMLGAIANSKSYIGQDINKEHVKESNEIISYLNIAEKANVCVKDIKTDSENSFDNCCLFTCPPYNLKEVWNEDEDNKSCDEWIDICLEKYKCGKYLFVVDNTEKYKDNIVKVLTNKSHFGINNEYVLLFKSSN